MHVYSINQRKFLEVFNKTIKNTLIYTINEKKIRKSDNKIVISDTKYKNKENYNAKKSIP